MPAIIVHVRAVDYFSDLTIEAMLPPFPESPGRIPAEPRVSIVVTNYNYERFLQRALDSALGQRDADVEVIVVDDGSTDGSRDIIARNGDRVGAILQDRQGQKSAFNAGLAAATGDILMFLDADDLLEPDTAAAVASAFAVHPEVGRVTFRLEVVDEAGRPAGVQLPSAEVPLPHGDVRRKALSFPDDLAWPPTSGNAFAAWVLHRVMPLPLDEERTGADYDLHALTPLLAPVLAIDRVGGAYRLHGRNAEGRQRFDLALSRLIIRRAQRSHVAVDRLARELGYGAARPRSVTIAAHRLVSIRIGRAGHPVPGDTRRRALAAGLAAALGRWDVSPARRALYCAWFLAAAAAPAGGVRALADASFQPMRWRRRPKLRRLVPR
jgi:glycosyltransferase involved in cell wall biosynthesis